MPPLQGYHRVIPMGLGQQAFEDTAGSR